MIDVSNDCGNGGHVHVDRAPSPPATADSWWVSVLLIVAGADAAGVILGASVIFFWEASRRTAGNCAARGRRGG
jgi:hypothetical protein